MSFVSGSVILCLLAKVNKKMFHFVNLLTRITTGISNKVEVVMAVGVEYSKI